MDHSISKMWNHNWSVKRSNQILFFALVLKCFKVLICCSSSPTLNSEAQQASYFTAGKSSLKRLGLHIQNPTCLPNLENEDENAMVGLSRRTKPPFIVSEKDVHFSRGM